MKHQPDMFLCPIDDLIPDPTQPRQFFDEEELKSLATSIQDKGVLLPIIVREHPRSPGKLEIVAGERRWRASKLVRLDHVPVVKRILSDKAAFEIALIENTQRANLNPIEEALSFKRLHEEHKMPYVEVSEVVGKSTSYVSNTLRLLNLEDVYQRMVISGELTSTGARALLAVPSGDLRNELAALMQKGMGPSEAESWAREMQQRSTARARPSKLTGRKPNQPLFDLLTSKLKERYGTGVSLDTKARSGSVSFAFKDLHGLYSLFKELTK
jgi:ParB family chromosome partitioning protein